MQQQPRSLSQRVEELRGLRQLQEQMKKSTRSTTSSSNGVPTRRNSLLAIPSSSSSSSSDAVAQRGHGGGRVGLAQNDSSHAGYTMDPVQSLLDRPAGPRARHSPSRRHSIGSSVPSSSSTTATTVATASGAAAPSFSGGGVVGIMEQRLYSSGSSNGISSSNGGRAEEEVQYHIVNRPLSRIGGEGWPSSSSSAHAADDDGDDDDAGLTYGSSSTSSNNDYHTSSGGAPPPPPPQQPSVASYNDYDYEEEDGYDAIAGINNAGNHSTSSATTNYRNTGDVNRNTDKVRGTFSDFDDDSEDELADLSVKGGAKQTFRRHPPEEQEEEEEEGDYRGAAGNGTFGGGNTSGNNSSTTISNKEPFTRRSYAGVASPPLPSSSSSSSSSSSGGSLPPQTLMPPPPPLAQVPTSSMMTIGQRGSDRSLLDTTSTTAAPAPSSTSSTTTSTSTSTATDPMGRVRVATQLLLDSIDEQARLRALVHQIQGLSDEDVAREIGAIDPSRQLLSVLSELERVVQQVAILALHVMYCMIHRFDDLFLIYIYKHVYVLYGIL